MAEQKPYTRKLFRQFDRLTQKASSPHQVKRIMGRMELNGFIQKHGKDVCDAMWEELKQKGEVHG
jgi:hypothetical protein